MRSDFDPGAAERRSYADPDAPGSPARRREWNSDPYPNRKDLEADRDEYDRLARRMSELVNQGAARSAAGDAELQEVWAALERVKNRHGGLPPAAD